jgi:hypothetical protein
MQRPPISKAPEAPPIVAPPVVGPPRADETKISQGAAISDGPSPLSSLLHRVVRDIKLGGVCLIIGLVVGQSSWLDRDRARTSTPLVRSMLPEPSPAQAVSTEPELSAVAGSWQARNDQTLDLSDDAYTSVEVESAAEVELPQRNVDKETEPMALATSPMDSDDTPETLAAGAVGSDEHKTKVLKQSPVQPARANIDGPPSIELLTAFDLATPATGPQCEDGTCQQNMESHGTVLKWAETPADAYRMAKEQDKLVFLIHVSGNFEIPGFT